MSKDTIIQWCDSTVNPVMGCDGCELWNHLKLGDPKAVRKCYAGVLTERYGGHSSGYPATFAEVKEYPGRMAEAAKWKDLRGVPRPDKPWIPPSYPRLVFISDMGDALSRKISFEYLKREIIDVVRGWPHIGLWLTKQPKRMVEFSNWLAARGERWPENLWPGTSVTSPDKLHRLRALARVGQGVNRFVSFEPLLGWQVADLAELKMVLRGLSGLIAWPIIGGESGHVHGPNCRDCTLPEAALCDVGVIEGMVELFERGGMYPFVKQLGSRPYRGMVSGLQRVRRACGGYEAVGNPATVGELLSLKDKKGGDWKEWPDKDFAPRLRVRRMPRLH